MNRIIIAAVFTLTAISPGSATEFLGVELCADRVDTGVILPADSPLSLESAEIGRHGGLVLLLHSKSDRVLDQVDDLMTSFTGIRGSGDDRKLEWSGNQITGFAQLIKKDYVALAVTATDDCTPEPETEPAALSDETELDTQPPTATTEETAPEGVAAVATAPDIAPDADAVAEEFALKGRLKLSAAEDGWVDVMGVVVNNSGVSYAVASFDLSLYDNSGDLICVDTISVNQLREGQERAFRGAIRCADYVADAVASWKLQFAGGH